MCTENLEYGIWNIKTVDCLRHILWDGVVAVNTSGLGLALPLGKQ